MPGADRSGFHVAAEIFQHTLVMSGIGVGLMRASQHRRLAFKENLSIARDVIGHEIRVAAQLGQQIFVEGFDVPDVDWGTGIA